MARRCGYCYDYGHNRRTCPTIKERIEANPDSYLARQEARKKTQRASSPRVCGWCSESGHNKRTCRKLETDRRTKRRQIREWRKKFVSQCQAIGFGVGSLLKLRDPETVEDSYAANRLRELARDQGEYAIVTALSAQALDCRQADRATRCVMLRFPSGRSNRMNLPIEFKELLGSYYEPMFEVGGRIDASEIGKLFNSSWHSGSDTVDELVGNE